MEFYIRKKHNESVEDYFDVSKGIVSKWRNVNVPDGRLNEFIVKEKSFDNFRTLFSNTSTQNALDLCDHLTYLLIH